MAGASGDRTLEQTPTWAVAVVCFVLVSISIVIEYIIHLIGKWLKKRNKRALYGALEKIKSELMLLGFISFLLTVGQGPISDICISKAIGATWHPCSKKEESKLNNDKENGHDKCAAKGKVPFVSADGIHQLHILIFLLALFHILYCIITLVLGRAKMRRWKAWELESRTADYQFSHDPERFRFARETTFGRRHLNFWSQSSILLWLVCFFRQFFRSVPKVDYLTLRHGFIIAHLAPQSQTRFDFQKYLKRSLEEDFKVVVGISPPIWFFAVLFLLFRTHAVDESFNSHIRSDVCCIFDGLFDPVDALCWYFYLWLPFLPLIIILLVGTKLQVIITKMGLRIQDRGRVVKGTPVVQPGDNLFWFNRPRLILHLIQFVLFQNAFQLAFLAWTWYEFGLNSCFHDKLEDVIIRISMGVLIQILCSYVILPLYALVTQMGSTMKPTIFNERVAKALRSWHHTAKKHIKQNRHSGAITPLSSKSGTPSGGTSSIHLLRYNRGEIGSVQTSPRMSNLDNEGGGKESPHIPSHHDNVSGSHPHRDQEERVSHEIDIHSIDFTFDKS